MVVVTREVHWELASLGQCPREVRGQRLCVAAWGLDLSASITIDRGVHATISFISKNCVNVAIDLVI